MKPIYFLIIAGILFIAIAFYWLQIRPSNIRAKCADPYYALEVISKTEGTNKSKEEIKKNLQREGVSTETRNSLYRNCLAYHGVKPEDLFK